MPTVELDIRQLADEGRTAPLAPITVTDAVLDDDGNTLTDTLDELKSGLIVKEQKSGTASFNNANFGVANIDVTKTGYTPLGVVAFRGGTNTILYRVSAINVTGNNVAVTVVNQTNASETSNQTVIIDVLYKKN